jgi:hypothetical protein
MKGLLLWVAVLLVVVFGGRELMQHISRSANENAATTRVQAFLDGLTPGGDFQKAFNMWETGATGAIRDMTQDQYTTAASNLNAWLTQRDLAHVERYEVLGARVVRSRGGPDTAAVEVSCTINGRPATILAIRGQRLEWVEGPVGRIT